MSTAATQWVRTRPVNLKAIQFDGSADQAQSILDWIKEGGVELCGHFRPPVGEVPGALLIPTPYSVLCVNKGDWVVQTEEKTFQIVTLECFDTKFQVVPCLPQ